MIKPSAIVTVGPHDHGPFHFRDTPHGCDTLPDGDTNLYTLADVLAALRQPSEAMIDAGDKKYEGTLIVEEAFLAMLDQFEREQNA